MPVLVLYDDQGAEVTRGNISPGVYLGILQLLRQHGGSVRDATAAVNAVKALWGLATQEPAAPRLTPVAPPRRRRR